MGLFDELYKSKLATSGYASTPLTQVPRTSRSNQSDLTGAVSSFLNRQLTQPTKPRDGSDSSDQRKGDKAKPETPVPIGELLGRGLLGTGAEGAVENDEMGRSLDVLKSSVGLDAADAAESQSIEALRQQNAQQLGAATDAMVAMDEYENSESLTPEAKAQIDEMRANLAVQIAQLESQEADLALEGAVNSRNSAFLQEQIFGEGAFLPGLTGDQAQVLDRVLGKTSGREDPHWSEVEAVMDMILESNLGDEEKAERLGFVVDRVQAQEAIGNSLENLVHDRHGMEAMAARTDLELLGNAAEFVQTDLGLDLSDDPILRQHTSMINFMEDGIIGMTGQSDIDPALVPLLTATSEDQPPGLLDQLAQNPDLLATPGFRTQAADVAKQLGVPPTAFENMLGEAVTRGQIYEENWNTALQQPQFTPGSEMLAIAIFQAALPLVGDPQLAAQFAESTDLHHLIMGQSGGKLGGDYAGDKHGIGGLSDHGYALAGVDYEEIRSDPEGELQALVKYILNVYGTPVEAINAYKRTGVWGE